MTQERLEILTIAFNPSLQPNPQEPPAAYAAVAAQLKATPGVNGVYAGPQTERPPLWTILIRWSTGDAHDAFVASETYLPWLASLRAVLADGEDSSLPEDAGALPAAPAGGEPPLMVHVAAGSVDAPLAAPTTEVFTCYGLDDGFLDGNLRSFAEGLESGGVIPGYHGLAYGAFTNEGEGWPKGQATIMLIGWDSKEAHEAQRGEDKVIDKYIHHVRTGRQAAAMFHVNLTRL